MIRIRKILERMVDPTSTAFQNKTVLSFQAQLMLASLALIPVSQANPLKTNRPENNGRKSKVRGGKGRGNRYMKERAGGLENRLQLACGSSHYKRGWGLKSNSPQRNRAWVHTCATKKSEDAGGSQDLCPVSTHKCPSTGLTICNRLSLGCGKKGVSISKPQSHLLSDKQTSLPFCQLA